MFNWLTEKISNHRNSRNRKESILFLLKDDQNTLRIRNPAKGYQVNAYAKKDSFLSQKLGICVYKLISVLWKENLIQLNYQLSIQKS